MLSSQKAQIIPENSSTAKPIFLLTIALHFRTNIKILSIRFDKTFCGNSVDNFDCRADLVFLRT